MIIVFSLQLVGRFEGLRREAAGRTEAEAVGRVYVGFHIGDAKILKGVDAGQRVLRRDQEAVAGDARLEAGDGGAVAEKLKAGKAGRPGEPALGVPELQHEAAVRPRD